MKLLSVLPGSSGRTRSRLFVYLALTAVGLLLAYQLVLRRGSVHAISLGDADNADLDGAISRNQPIHPVHRELVFAAMRSTDMSWVNETVPQWPANIYRVDVAPGEAAFTVPANRGNEAMVYLTYLIDRYWTLPDIIVFLHGDRYQWHNDNPLYDSVVSINDLNTDYVLEAGYVNLRCSNAIGCPIELEPARYFRDRPSDPDHPTAVAFPDSFMELFPGQGLPETVGVPCCSQFALSRAKVHERDREDYIRMRQWLIETHLDAGVIGRVLEYTWHIMFGKPAQFCIDPRECYCKTYGYCKMTKYQLNNQWTWRGLVLPEGWPEHDPMKDFQ